MKWGPAVWPILLLCLFLPTLASAQVVINEVMYNPQGSDSGREWIELYNEGQSDVTMVGGSGKGSWRISDGSNHTLTDPAGGTGRGSLVVPAGGYLVIASDPNDFISGEYAGGAYSVAKSSLSLNNNGATLTLLDGTGATVDTVSYTPSQGANDDSSSLQKQVDGSWIAALPTPGDANSTTVYVPPSVENSSQSDTSSSSSGQQQTSSANVTPSYVPPPTPDLFADAGGDRTAIVGADVEFDASAYDKMQTLLDPTTVRFMWNFGDGSSAEGAAVLHHFSYPGRYAVVLNMAEDKNAASDQITVTAEPAALSFTLFADGGIAIQNNAGHDLDLSGWIVRENDTAFAAQFMLPGHSEILSGASMNIPAQTLSFRASSSTLLEYPNGVFALAIGGNSTASSSVSAPVQSSTPVATPAVRGSAKTSNLQAIDSEDAAQPDATDTDSILDTGTDALDQPQATSTVIETAAASVSMSSYLWWAGVLTLAFAAGAAILAAGYFKRGEWDIIEDNSE